MIRILYADGSRRDRDLVRPFLGTGSGEFHVTEVRTLSELCESVQSRDCDLVLGDFDLSGCLGLELVHAVKARRPSLPIVILSADKDRAREALKLGVTDCLSKTPDELGRLPQIVRGVIERTRLELEKGRVEDRLRMVTRARRVMADCSRLQARASVESQLLQDTCRVLVESGGYGTAWVGMVRHDKDKTIEPVASAGEDASYLASTKISWGEDAAGQGPAGMAVRTRTAQAARHLQTDPYFSARFEVLIARGYRAAAAFPLICDNEVVGVIGILAAEPEAFEADELALLDELARDIAYSMSNLRLRATQRRSEQLLRLEHTVTRCLAETGSVDDAMRTVMRTVCETQGWDCGRYFRLDEAAGLLRFEEAWGVPHAGIEEFIERSRALALGPGTGLAGHVWQTGEPLWIADIRNDSRALGTIYTPESGIRGAFLFSIKSEGKTYGVLAFSSREIREPDERLLEAVRVIGSQIGQFLHRKHAEIVVRESEARFRGLTRLSSDTYWEMDTDLRFVALKGERLLEPEAEVLGKRREDLTGMELGPHWDYYREQTAARQPFRDFVYARIDATGSRRFISVSGEPIFDTEGRFKGYRGIGKEVTARKREEQLLALEHAVTRCLATADSEAAALQTVIRAVCETEGWDCGRYFRLDENAGVLRFDAAWGVSDAGVEEFIERSRTIAVGRGVGLAGCVWESGEPLWIADITKDTRTLGTVYTPESGIRAAFLFPVNSEGKAIGVLAFSSRAMRQPDERLLEAVRAIGSQIGEFLRRRQADEELQQFRAAMDTSSDMIVLVDRATMRYIDVNATACQMHGYTREEMLRLGPQDVADISRQELEHIYDDMIAGGQTTWRKSYHRRKDGTLVPMEAFRRAVRTDRGWIIVGIIRDVSERARAEQLQELEHGIARCLSESENPTSAMTAVIRDICESEGWECGRYFRVNDAAGGLLFTYSWHVPDPAFDEFIERSRGAVYRPGAGLVGRVWQSGEPLWSTNLKDDPRALTRSHSLEMGIRAAFVFPVTAEGKTIGVLSFSTRRARDPDDALLRAVHAIGRQIGQYLRRMEAEQVLRESEERFRSLNQLSSDWYWELDQHLRIMVLKGKGLPDTEEAVRGKRWDEVPGIVPAGPGWEGYSRATAERRPFRDLVHQRDKTDGSRQFISISGEPVVNERGEFRGYRGTGRDVTERERAERLQNLEHSVARCLAESESTAAALTAVMRAICETEGWEAGRYFRADDEAGVLRFSHAWTVADPAVERFVEESRGIVFPRGSGLSGRAWETGQPLWSMNIEDDPRAFPAARVADRSMSLRGVFVFPVTAEGKVIGMLNFFSRKVREPDAALLRAVGAIGSQIGQFAQRKQAENVLRESEARFRSLTTLSSDLYWEQDDQYRFTVFGGTALGSNDGVRWQYIGKRRWDRKYLNMSEADWVAHIADLEARRPFRDLELCRLNEAGQQVWFSVSGEPIFDPDGTFKGYRGIGKDITARKLTAHRQAMEHAVTRALAESFTVDAAMPELIHIVCESLGWACGAHWRWDETAELLRCVDTWHIDADAVAEFAAASRDNTNEAPAWRGGSPPGATTGGLVRAVWSSGSPVWVPDVTQHQAFRRGAIAAKAGLHCAFGFPILAGRQPLGVMEFFGPDIKEPDEALLQIARAMGSQIGQFVQRKKAEAVLRESEARFRSLTTLSSDWYWEQDAEYRFIDMTTEIDRVTGVSALAHIGKRRWELAAPNMTEADWVSHRAVVEAHQPFHDLELCRRAEDGSLRWVSISGEPIFDTGGKFTGYRGIGKDITARKREERVLALEHAVTRSLAEADSASRGLRAVMHAVCEAEGWECGRYLRLDEAAGVMRFSEHWSGSDPTVEQFIAGKRDAVYGPGEGLTGKAWQSGQPLWAADTTQDERGLKSAVNAETGMRGAFVFPVAAEGKTIGVFAFNSREVRDPDERLLRAVHAIGIQIGQFLQRKEADEKVSNQALQQRLIAEFGQQALASAELAEVLDGAAMLVASTLKADYSSVLQLDSDGKQLTYKAAIGWPQEWAGRRVVPINPGSRLEYILNRGEPMIIEDYIAASDFAPTPLLREYGIRSGVQVPILGTRIAYGVLSMHTPEPRRFTDDEVSFMRSVANILAIAIQRKHAEDKLAHLAQFDTVTTLPNRYLLRDRLGQALSQAQRNHWLSGVLFVDLDRFKAVNDTYGHSVGDKLLHEVSARLVGCVRSGDTVGRLSGDEFAVVLSNLAKGDDAGLVAKKIVTALAAPFDLDGHQTYISASVGIALYPGDGSEPDALLKNADTAMYRAKEQGRNCYQFYLPQMNDRLMERLQLEARLRGALDRGEFRLHYQPKVQLDTGVISGFEALLRWQQDDGLVPPTDFIPILEDTGLIVPVGEWVLRSVCEQLKQWQDRGIVPRPIAVNLSGRQFRQHYLVTTVERILRETGIAPELLEFELTETLLMSDAEEAVQMLRELKRLGVRLSVDDFGTGYSSLSYLKRFPLDTLKIDRAFVRDAVSDPDDAILTLTIINLAHSMRLRVVAEGVETPGQLNFLRMHGCDEMQGYYFARPLEIAACTEALLEDRRMQKPDAPRVHSAPTLLLVDDSERDLVLLERALACDDFHIATALGATAAFEVLAQHGADIVVSDFQMPGMNGVQFLTNVRKLYPDAVRVVITGGDEMPTLTSAINSAGIHKFLAKSWDADRLRTEVRAAFGQERRRPAADEAAIPLPTISLR